jgi:pyrroloquinoline quinone biosynthesis protein E
MDGTRSDDELDAILSAANPDTGPRLLAALVHRLGPLLVRGVYRPLEHRLDELAAVLPPDPTSGLRRLPGPRVLHWTVTRFCPKKCVYCYAEPLFGGRARDAVIRRDELARIFAEARSLGAESLIVSGSEPLLREDLPEVMGDARAAGITPVLTTKHPISAELAARLAAARVGHISFSLDTMDEEESARLIGSRGYPDQVRRSVEHLARVGVAFSIQSVLTAHNLEALGAVAAFAAHTGAKVMQIVPFEPVRMPITEMSNDALALARPEVAAQIVDELGARHPSMRVELFEQLGSGERAGYHCDIGMTKLFFLPDGVVHRCYKLAGDDTLKGTDLRVTSVAAAWHDSGFRTIISPPREAYRDGECGGCSRFSGCHDDGRCIYQALVDHGRYTAPDRPCGGPHPAPPVSVAHLTPLRARAGGPPLHR